MNTLGFLNIGTQEMVLIVIVMLLLFGGKKLPELARGLGRGIREFKDASEDIKREISDQINNFDKDLDVTDSSKSSSNTTNTNTPVQHENTVVENAVDVEKVEAEPIAEKKFPQFSAPEGTFQHNPGGHPEEPIEHYKYGYTDHFASNENTEGENGVDKSSQEEQKQA